MSSGWVVCLVDSTAGREEWWNLWLHKVFTWLPATTHSLAALRHSAKCGAARCASRCLVKVQLVEDEMQRVLAVLGDVEIVAADLVAERPFGVFA